jgi:3-methyladenine DNA glycosylase AlkD
MPDSPTAEGFIAELLAHQSDIELAKIRRYFKSGIGDYGAHDHFVGIRMGTVFECAKRNIAMPIAEIETVLDSDIHEIRAGALSLMGKKSQAKATTAAEREALVDLYFRRHDRVNNWDLVDLGALYLVGPYLVGKSKDILYDCARSDNLWQRRTALYSCQASIHKGDVDDALALCSLLLSDHHDLTQKAVGTTLRSVGRDSGRLLQFLDHHASTMGRTALRYAIEKLDPEERRHYMGR